MWVLGVGGSWLRGHGGNGEREEGKMEGDFKAYIFDTLYINRLLHIQLIYKPDVYFKFKFYL